MRVLILGKNGQLAQSLLAAAEARSDYAFALGSDTLDLGECAVVADSLSSWITKCDPDVIINAAAYTAVDKAESEEELALKVNAEGPEAAAKAAAKAGLPFLHVSTDYVFDGKKSSPYSESDTVGPTGAYGRSKLEGERRILGSHPEAVIFRTAWVYSPYGNNFLKTMLRLGERREELGVVADQYGTPSYAPDLAVALLEAAEKFLSFDRVQRAKLSGITHLVNSGYVTWHGFAEAIFKESAARGGKHPVVKAIGTNDFPTPAARPANSRLATDRLNRVWGIGLPDWKNGIGRCLDALAAK